MPTLVILPTYNERENITALVRTLLELGDDFTVCVVDDNSPDGTAQLVRDFRERELPEVSRSRLHLIVRDKKDGRGGAVRTGLQWGLAQTQPVPFDSFIEMDCDFSHPPSDIPRGLALLRDADVVMGCRYPDGQIIGWPLHRRLLSFGANTLARCLIRWHIADYTNGFRFYSRRSAELMSRLPQQHKGYIYLSETITAFLHYGHRIRCFPIKFVNRARGVSNTTFREVRSSLTGIFQIAWRYRFGQWDEIGSTAEVRKGVEGLARPLVADDMVVAEPLDPARLIDTDLRGICLRMHAILDTVEMPRCEGRLLPRDLFDAIDTLESLVVHGPRPRLSDWTGVISEFGAYYGLAGSGPITVGLDYWQDAASRLGPAAVAEPGDTPDSAGI